VLRLEFHREQQPSRSEPPEFHDERLAAREIAPAPLAVPVMALLVALFAIVAEAARADWFAQAAQLAQILAQVRTKARRRK
jgi:hypothetical protein